MKVEYDPASGGIYVRLIKNAKVAKTVQCNDKITLILDLDEKNQVIGIELLTVVGKGKP
jgi:uncharacterized protein YuzE